MSDIEIKLTVFRELEQKLTQLPLRVAKNILARTVYAGAAIVRNEARSKCPVRTGALRKSIRIRRRKVSRGDFMVVYGVGPTVYYGHLVEYGTKAHWIKPRVKRDLAIGQNVRAKVYHPGATPRPYLRPALDSNKDRIISAMRDKLNEGISREFAK